MAEKESKSKKGEKKGGREKAKPKHLHQIIHTFEPHGGGVKHDHVYKDHADDEDHKAHKPQFMGVSDNIEDLMQHDQDHAGPQMAAGAGEEPQPGEDPAAAAAGAGAPPAAAAPAAGTPPPAGV